MDIQIALVCSMVLALYIVQPTPLPDVAMGPASNARYEYLMEQQAKVDQMLYDCFKTIGIMIVFMLLIIIVYIIFMRRHDL